MEEAEAAARAVMEHVRALRQELLTGGPQPDDDERRSGLTGPQVAVMRRLVEEGQATVTALAAALHLSHSTTSGIVDRLQARGLVERVRDEGDGRRTLVAVTGPVQAYVRELAGGPFTRLVRALDAATPEERAAVLRGLDLLRGLLAGSGTTVADGSPQPPGRTMS